MSDLNLKNIPTLKGCVETWRRFEDTNYYVSSEGRVINAYHGEHLVEPYYKKGRYRITIHLSDHRRTKDYPVHTMQFIAFYGAIPKGYIVENRKY